MAIRPDIVDEDVMEDQIYVLPEKWITKRTGLSMRKLLLWFTKENIVDVG